MRKAVWVRLLLKAGRDLLLSVLVGMQESGSESNGGRSRFGPYSR